ncbi:uncharacterized protein LOC142539035 [Primulina tabacum]|uniref:uncharacterized protein LOC142539035 n=1 Tax=Primulina tabacum TaxID=48773 RepID=UPI003F596DB5
MLSIASFINNWKDCLKLTSLMQFFSFISYQLEKIENDINERKKSMTMLRKKLFGDTKEFAVLANFFALLKLLLLELPNQRFPLALTQFDESTSREMKESFDKNVLKHNVASEVSGLLDSFFFVVEEFELLTHEGFCHISLAAGVARFGEIQKFRQREQKLIADFDRLLLKKDKLNQKMEALQRR